MSQTRMILKKSAFGKTPGSEIEVNESYAKVLKRDKVADYIDDGQEEKAVLNKKAEKAVKR